MLNDVYACVMGVCLKMCIYLFSCVHEWVIAWLCKDIDEVCVSACVCLMCVWLCVFINVHESVYICMYECTYRHVYMYVGGYMHAWCVWALTPLSVYGYVVQRYRPVWWDSDLLQKIQFSARYEPDTLAIQRPTHVMIRRFILVHAVKTRRWFGFKLTSFHVSVCSYVISLFTIVDAYLCSICIISCDRLVYFTSMIIHTILCDVGECSLYLYSWYERLSVSFHVIVGCH